MPPRSKSQQQSAAPESTASRRSARIAGSAAPPSAAADGKKRSASAPKSGPASKKQKTTTNSTSKASRSTKSKPAEEKIDEEPEAGEAETKDAANGANGNKAETNGDASASKKEREAEAPAAASPEAPSGGVLKLGDTLPSLKLQDEQGKDVELSGLAGDKGVVLFLYPKADTPGCTNQACGYRDAYDEIKELGYEIYGLSKDKPAAQLKWRTKKELNYSLLSDPESKFIKKLGAFVQPNNTKRSHFIFEKGSGKLIDIALGVKPANDPSNCVAFLKKHHK